MSKVGRNEPCHCDSGKKYKKCCIQKDKEESIKQQEISENPRLEWTSDEEWEEVNDLSDEIYDDDYDEEEHEGEEEYYNNIPDHIKKEVEKYSSRGYDEDYPCITSEEEIDVDNWWDEYKKMKDPDAIKNHLDEFLANHSINAIHNLGLEHEVLFELISDFVKAGRADDIIPYMMEFREKYPDIYIKSAGYYDSDIISWLISKNRNDEIINYLNYFENYPIKHIEKLFELTDLLHATDNAEIILPLIKKVYKAICYSDEVFGGYEIIGSLVVSIYSKYLNKKNIKELINELKALDFEFADLYYDINFWEERLINIIKDYEKWDEKLPKKKQQLYDKIFNICSNFEGFLNKEKNMSNISAEYYSKKMFDYFESVFEGNKKPKSLFFFTKNQIDNIVVGLSKGFFSVNSLKALPILNSLYYFAEYLFVCGNFNETQRDEMQKITTEFHQVIYKKTINHQIETSVFEEFPMF